MRFTNTILAEMTAVLPDTTEEEAATLYLIACMIQAYEFHGELSIDAMFVLRSWLKDMPAAVKFIPASLFVEMEMNNI
jgi:hypothetical protein